MSGGYDDGYAACSCFWGIQPGSLVSELLQIHTRLDNWRVLDAGCGEGKNAVCLAHHGAVVEALDLSPLAIKNALQVWNDVPGITWSVTDIRQLPLPPASFDLVVAYGLMHCLSNAAEITQTAQAFQEATAPNGYHIVCAFNDRYQELDAHPGFNPCLVPHSFYCELYRDWTIIHASDTDLRETHPHNGLEHVHSMTRLIARKV